MAPVLYERIDENNVRIGTKWFRFAKKWIYGGPLIAHHFDNISGVTIFEDGAKRFISNSWYLDEEIERL